MFHCGCEPGGQRSVSGTMSATGGVRGIAWCPMVLHGIVGGA